MNDSLEDPAAVHTMPSLVFPEVPCGSPSSPGSWWHGRSTCWGPTGLGAGNNVTARLECHLLSHHHCYPWHSGGSATGVQIKAATPEIFKLCLICNHMFKWIWLYDEMFKPINCVLHCPWKKKTIEHTFFKQWHAEFWYKPPVRL